ncbi:uncharacterized protein LOC106136299 isoform X2 [Amyelois transitella]|nr:uncharacterized protein LOC106136299 isoform X2 [Amyelois transitella]XP_060804076.1 uncharacterized protein LOC106136299 isoform X2 [Amyelois transitella]XP_060804077.1 uncharacterized protein LOC106136299 isoform X2 [Amyelois transitella]XP_060804078.1 uncharacterized protein LOC106136299 isoform X2 [Amyelois transitella]
MPWPTPKRCCGCLSVETKFYVSCTISILLCVANITAGAWNLPRNKQREPEDNLISMSMVMFSTLSTIGNLVACGGAWFRRPGYLQLSLVFNSVFIVCLYLIAIVTCLFSPELQSSGFLDQPENIALVVIAFFAGLAYTTYYLIAVNNMYRYIRSGGASPIPI